MAAGYRETLAELYGRAGKDYKFCIERVEDAARGLGSPHVGLRAVHIGGSNGKGSVTSMLAGYLARCGLRTGRFTSPHLHRYTERMSINGREIPRSEVVRLFRALDGHVARGSIPWLTFFEITTLIAMRWFADEKVDVAVVEVGLGGRLDATNVLEPVAGAVTSISLEHTNVLGKTLAAVAREKAGILKEGMPVVLGRLPRAALGVFESVARERGCTLWRCGREWRFTPRDDGSFDYDGPGARLERVRPGLAGQHQIHNSAMVVALADLLQGRGFPLDEGRLRESVRRTRWPGRLEKVADDPETIMDCAHNPEGLRALARALSGRRFFVVFGAMFDKPVPEMLGLVEPLAARLYITAPDAPRALAPDRYPKHVKGVRIIGVARAVDRARMEALRAGMPVLVTGSIFNVAEARAHVLGLRHTDPIITQ